MVTSRGRGVIEHLERGRQAAALDMDASERDGEIGLFRVHDQTFLQQPRGLVELAAFELERCKRLTRALMAGVSAQRAHERGFRLGRAPALEEIRTATECGGRAR